MASKEFVEEVDLTITMDEDPRSSDLLIGVNPALTASETDEFIDFVGNTLDEEGQEHVLAAASFDTGPDNEVTVLRIPHAPSVSHARIAEQVTVAVLEARGLNVAFDAD